MAEYDDNKEPNTDGAYTLTTEVGGGRVTWEFGGEMRVCQQNAVKNGDVNEMMQALIASLVGFASYVEFVIRESSGDDTDDPEATDTELVAITAEVSDGLVTWVPGPRVQWHLQEAIAEHGFTDVVAPLQMMLGDYVQHLEEGAIALQKAQEAGAGILVAVIFIDDDTVEPTLNDEAFDKEASAFFDQEERKNPPTDEHPAP